jgi:hypothetical protein
MILAEVSARVGCLHNVLFACGGAGGEC